MKELPSFFESVQPDGEWKINVCSLTGRELRSIPKAMRDGATGFTDTDLLRDAFGDPAVDPRSGGIIGVDAIAAFMGWGEKHTRRVLRDLEWIPRVGDVPATQAPTSLQAFKETYEAQVSNRRAEAARRRWR